MNTSVPSPRLSAHRSNVKAFLIVIAAAIAWGLAYNLILPLANGLTFNVLGLQPGSQLGESVAFFLYDVPKILLLLGGMIFVITVIQSFFSPEKTRAFLAGKHQGVGNVLAAALGVVTPFCSCSAVPLFIGFVKAGIPIGVTFSFLIAAPLVNEVALILLLGLFGWQVAAFYALSGVTIAIFAGALIGKTHPERFVEPFVFQVKGSRAGLAEEKLGWPERFSNAWQTTREIVGKTWPFIVIGIAIGAGIHGYVPQDALAGIMGREAWWSVPAAVLLGVPLYSNAAGIVPVVQALVAKGAALGTVLAFMMAVVGLSLPEIIILRLVLKPRLIAIFVLVVATGIVFIGYLFNLVMPR
jgi:uncharacterized membrane protein YraQ (UPF0718 family)